MKIMVQKSAIVLLFSLMVHCATFGQKTYFKTGNIIEDTLTYAANKEKDRAKYEAIAKPVFIRDKMTRLRSNQDSIIYSYARSIVVGKQPEGATDEVVYVESLITNESEDDDMIGKEFPLPELKTLAGNTLNIEKLKGKPTMINLWFTSCAPCVAEMPVLNKLKDKYGDAVNFISLAADSNEKVETFLKKREFNFTHIVAEEFIRDELKILEFPKNIFLDRNGRVAGIEDGIPYIVDDKKEPTIGDGKDFELIIDALLNQLK